MVASSMPSRQTSSSKCWCSENASTLERMSSSRCSTGSAGVAGDDFHQAFFEERLALLVFRFEDAVGEENHAVDLRQRDAWWSGRLDPRMRPRPGPFSMALGGDLADAVRAVDDRARVAGAGIAEGAGGEIDHAVEGGGEHGGVRRVRGWRRGRR